MYLRRCLTRKLTLGQSQDSVDVPSVILQAEAQVVAVGIAVASPEELQIIATDHFFQVESFNELSQFVLDISDAVLGCNTF